MIKNENSAEKRTIRVMDADGQEAGQTYPKRAAGLVKKGRACYVNDFTIRLNTSDTIQNSEGNKMDEMNRVNGNEAAEQEVRRVFFDPRHWSFNKECQKNVGNRSFMEGPDGEITEAYMIGNWSWDWTEIISETLLLKKNAKHSFIFWLNGGENDRNDEVCRFEVIMNNDHDNRYTYNLNRNFIKPLKKLNGWELYEIPFYTQNNEYTQLKFIAQKAYMTVMPAKAPESYAQIPDSPDPFEGIRPQRHNLIFADGWPANGWYSTGELMRKYGMEGKAAVNSVSGGKTSEQQLTPNDINELRSMVDSLMEEAEHALEGLNTDKLAEQLQNELRALLNVSEVDADMEEIVSDALEAVQDTISDAVDDINDNLDELIDNLDAIACQIDEVACRIDTAKPLRLDFGENK